MNIYDKTTLFKKNNNLNNKDLGNLIDMTGDAFRMALKRKSLSGLQIRELENYFENNSIKSVESTSNKDDYMIMKPVDIKLTRQRLGYTQKDFAKKLGVSHRTVQTWESGERNISQSTALLIKEIESRETKNAPISEGENVVNPSLFPVSFNNIDSFVNFFITNQTLILQHKEIDKLIELYEDRAIRNFTKNKGS